MKKLGFILIIFSFIFYGLILIVPFLNVSTGFKTAVTGILIIVGEISFWVGGLILGREVVKKYRNFFNIKKWFKKNENEGSD
ncbi:transporter suffix domain-containing protein [Chengkuizengella sediminis]|uniref:transporter suffix domain-containing protein n=1 Tax=Chengkuizengella sediminis TaxID=1885917 RepID=UPI001F0FDE66|nr:transporter suffix domain-containing protein [Chengkuizengella sediminis]